MEACASRTTLQDGVGDRNTYNTYNPKTPKTPTTPTTPKTPGMMAYYDSSLCTRSLMRIHAGTCVHEQAFLYTDAEEEQELPAAPVGLHEFVFD